MEKQKFITEQPKTRVYRDHWNAVIGETYVKINGICYHISTSKNSRGVIRSSAVKVSDNGADGSMHSTSFSFTDMMNSIELGAEKAIATEAKVTALHRAAVEKFMGMKDELPSHDEYKIEVGQVVFLNGYGQDENRHDRLIVYKVDEFKYFTVNSKTLQLSQDSLSSLRPIEEKQGIGHYYKKGDVVTPEQAAELLEKALAKAKADEEARPAREAAARAEREAAIIKLVDQYPYLERVSEYSGGKHAARNIRIELAREFPGIKFSVTSDNSSVNVKWTDGPPKDRVNKIIRKYVDHTTDFTGDYRDYTPSLFNEVFGGSSYVFADRTQSDGTNLKLINYVREYSRSENLEDEAFKVFAKNAIPLTSWEIKEGKIVATEPATPAEPSGVTGVTIHRNEEKCGIEIAFSNKPDESIIELLKLTGFRWSRFSKVWWAKYTDELWDFANNISAIMAE